MDSNMIDAPLDEITFKKEFSYIVLRELFEDVIEAAYEIGFKDFLENGNNPKDKDEMKNLMSEIIKNYVEPYTAG